MRILAIESSCDETAAAIVDDGRFVRSSVVASQIELHRRFGGVVPELAGRAHLERIVPVIAEALDLAGVTRSDPRTRVEAVAATVGPGLVGSLLVGIAAAKSLAVGWDVPFVGVNHLEGHLYAALLEDPEVALPAVVLLVSGGHTLLVEMSAPGAYRVLGGTVDDAAGEAFDKIARFLGLGYPGGPLIEKAAADGDPCAFTFPRPMANQGLDMSFSGLKTAVVQAVRAAPTASVADVAASFQAAVVDVLVAKALAAVSARGARSLCLAGGVAANGPLRDAARTAGEAMGVHVYVPSLAMCTDNAAMIGAAATVRLDLDGPSSLAQGAEPSLGFALPRGA